MDLLSSVYASFPLASHEESASVRQYFWATVVLSWLLTFVPQGGRSRNYSIVDRLWPLYPPTFLIQWIWQLHEYTVGKQLSSHALFLCALVFVWSLRLCYNSIRRGDYRVGAEDYRWIHVRQSFAWMHPVVGTVAWEVFNFGFISAFQLGLLYLIVWPARFLVLYGEEHSWSALEVLLAVLMCALVLGEALADQQQFDFQQRKKKQHGGSSSSQQKEGGFVHKGLWRFSRHPNVFCEQAFWATLAVYCAVATGVDLGDCDNAHYLLGPLVLIVLMWASVGLTERITLAKYPLYRAYQLKTSRLVPWVPATNAHVISTAAAAAAPTAKKTR
ncbi:hypothetical protein BX661DRAFT_176432 [Kickxella alabastrina]|uniref:uncharacterized protein n=1 Tax=Kickxella alabastrina TaxID=61397 RepID=UPI00221F1BBA|nr:uncharacterized protein BX661DRAFT_176432 [Kickxella alabastrina]KAI7833986.1 hypothetical protein BX661DRAFT_176432 [Kickxella alabastrina]